MASIITARLFFTLVLFSSLFSVSSSTRSLADSSTDWWCNQTPHREQCKHFMTHSYLRCKPKHKSEFRNMLVQLAMEQAQALHSPAHEMAPKCVTEKRNEIFTHCVKLYDDAIYHLNRTVEGLHNGDCSVHDAQTWLSAALTNIETCRIGASQLCVDDFAANKASDVVGKMISNVLAVNGEFLMAEAGNHMKRQEGKEDGFPRWFSRRQRRLLRSTASSVKANLVVAKDGSGHFRTVQEAIDVASRRGIKTRFVIRVKRGVYEENIEVDKDNANLMIVGDGMNSTIISSNRSVQDGYTTYSSATAGIDGPQFIAQDISIRNTAGAEKGQAVALRSASDLSVFYRCAIEGHQDTLMAHAQRQFYRDCRIFGTVDFIFGNAAVVLQNCTILVRRPLQGQANMITAQGRGDPYQNTGISIVNSQIRAAPDFRPFIHEFQTYLGRPWQQYSRVVVMNTYIEGLVSPLGWSPWGNTNFAQDTCYFGEYMNYGNGSSTKDRVKWPGFHAITTPNEAAQFTVAKLLVGQTWLPSTGVPFTAGL